VLKTEWFWFESKKERNTMEEKEKTVEMLKEGARTPG
jgi:hypothetical protein